jgi:hypothetical protein
MDKSTKPDFLREARLQDCLDFLDKLRKSGVTNMFDVRQTLRQAFPDLTTKQTAEVVGVLDAHLYDSCSQRGLLKEFRMSSRGRSLCVR